MISILSLVNRSAHHTHEALHPTPRPIAAPTRAQKAPRVVPAVPRFKEAARAHQARLEREEWFGSIRSALGGQEARLEAAHEAYAEAITID